MEKREWEGYAPLSQNRQVLTLLLHKQISDGLLKLLTLVVVEREVRRDLGQDEDRVLDVHVLARLEALDETLRVSKEAVNNANEGVRKKDER
jgi:hypothetical protein